MKISSKFLALLLGGAVLVAGCEEKNTGNGKNEGNNGEQAVLFLDGSASETIEIGGESQTKTLQVSSALTIWLLWALGRTHSASGKSV